jgi:sporulation protein YlmC with PRC-barrel domain
MVEITSDDILGKDVVDPHGDIIGIAQQLRIEKDTKKIVGVVVDQGFLKPDLYVGLDYVTNFGIDSIYINRFPVPKLRGFEVYDVKGRLVGYVSDVAQTKERMSAIIVRRSVWKKPMSLDSKFIKSVGFSVILNLEEHELDWTKPARKKRIWGLI